MDEAAAGAGTSYLLEVHAFKSETSDTGGPEEETASGLTGGEEGPIEPGEDADFWTVGALMNGARVFALSDGVASDATHFDLRVATAHDTPDFDDLDNDIEYGADAPNVAGTPQTG